MQYFLTTKINKLFSMYRKKRRRLTMCVCVFINMFFFNITNREMRVCDRMKRKVKVYIIQLK